MGFEIITGIIGHLQVATTSNNRISWVYTFYNSLRHTLNLLSLLCLHQSSGNGFERQMFPSFWFPKLSPCLSHSNCAHNYFIYTPLTILTHSAEAPYKIKTISRPRVSWLIYLGGGHLRPVSNIYFPFVIIFKNCGSESRGTHDHNLLSQI
jgi:hypothetical protein